MIKSSFWNFNIFPLKNVLHGFYSVYFQETCVHQVWSQLRSVKGQGCSITSFSVSYSNLCWTEHIWIHTKFSCLKSYMKGSWVIILESHNSLSLRDLRNSSVLVTHLGEGEEVDRRLCSDGTRNMTVLSCCCSSITAGGPALEWGAIKVGSTAVKWPIFQTTKTPTR